MAAMMATRITSAPNPCDSDDRTMPPRACLGLLALTKASRFVAGALWMRTVPGAFQSRLLQPPAPQNGVD